jgi:S-adenosylmethionine:diacylglycerol 3-amino-3-carboxypropyl transferase
MYEDPAIELRAFPPGARVFCIASAGDMALELARGHRVTAVDINPVQLSYARARLSGAPAERGTAERLLALGRSLLPLAGWRRSVLEAFLSMDDPVRQLAFWERHLDTRRFRAGIDVLLSVVALRSAYSAPLLDALPPRFGRVVRRRMERCFGRHPNVENPFARGLLLGEFSGPAIGTPTEIELICVDAAEFLERGPPATFDAFTLSNILDGAPVSYRERLLAAVQRAASSEAVVVLRSFGEPTGEMPTNLAGEDRSMLWGIVDVRRVEDLAQALRGGVAPGSVAPPRSAPAGGNERRWKAVAR